MWQAFHWWCKFLPVHSVLLSFTACLCLVEICWVWGMAIVRTLSGQAFIIVWKSSSWPIAKEHHYQLTKAERAFSVDRPLWCPFSSFLHPPINILKELFLWSHWVDWSQKPSHESSEVQRILILFLVTGLNGHHAHIWFLVSWTKGLTAMWPLQKRYSPATFPRKQNLPTFLVKMPCKPWQCRHDR